MAARGKKNTSVADRINSLIFRARADIKDRSLPSRKLFPACMFIATLDRLFLSLVYTFFNTPVCISLPPLFPPPKKRNLYKSFRVARLEWRKLRREKKQKKYIYPPLPPKKTSTREKKRNDKNIYVYIYILKRRRLKHWEQLPPQLPPPLQRSSQIRISRIFHFSTESRLTRSTIFLD